jgi:hypothetical protein
MAGDMLAPLLGFLLVADGQAVEATENAPSSSPDPEMIVDFKIGEGFRKHSFSIEAKLTRALGTTENGSQVSHNFWLTQIQGGMMLTGLLAPAHWWAGNLEVLGQLLVGVQDRPEDGYFAGLNGGLRYHFRTGTLVDPFIGGSVGVAATDVGEPDLGGIFQFNEQVGAGARFFLSSHHAITLEYAFWHVSNGSIQEPNHGVNAHLVSLGFAWLF